MAFLTDYAVRPKGDVNVALLYCVMCLADGDTVPATHLIELDEHDAGYCRLCAAVMHKNGHKPRTIESAAPRKPGTRGPIPQELRKEIAESALGSTYSIAKKFGVSEPTVKKIRQEAEAQRAACEDLAATPTATIKERLDQSVELINEYAKYSDSIPLAPAEVEAFERIGVPSADDLDRDAEEKRVAAETEVQRRAAIINDYVEHIQRHIPVTLPIAVPAESLSPDQTIVFHISEDKADRIWNTSTVERKLAFARAELLERLEAL